MNGQLQSFTLSGCLVNLNTSMLLPFIYFCQQKFVRKTIRDFHSVKIAKKYVPLSTADFHIEGTRYCDL